jgi:hypothetical protein
MDFATFAEFSIASGQGDFIFVYDPRDGSLFLHADFGMSSTTNASSLRWNSDDAAKTIANLRAGLRVQDFASEPPPDNAVLEIASARFGSPCSQLASHAFRIQIHGDAKGRQQINMRILKLANAPAIRTEACHLLALLERAAIASLVRTPAQSAASAARL